MSPLYRTLRLLFKGWFILFYRHKVFGLQHIPEGGAIIAPNHASYLDPPLVGVSFPEEINYLARASLFTHYGLSFFIRNLNAYPITGTATDLASIKTILSLLLKDKKVVIFPEGVRTHDGKLTPIRSGIGMLAMRSGTPIIPVYLGGTFEAWPRQRRIPRLFGNTVCVIGTPIRIENFDMSDKKEAQIAIGHAVRESILHLKEWYEKGAVGEPP